MSIMMLNGLRHTESNGLLDANYGFSLQNNNVEIPTNADHLKIPPTWELQQTTCYKQS